VNPHANAGNLDVELYEVHRSTGTATYDTGSASTTLTSCTSCTPPSITLAGPDFVATWGGFFQVPSISSPYSNPNDIDNVNVFGGFAGALNQSSYSAATWSQSPADVAAISTVAFK
jgi:hypothetical protein